MTSPQVNEVTLSLTTGSVDRGSLLFQCKVVLMVKSERCKKVGSDIVNTNTQGFDISSAYKWFCRFMW